jgi:hypothetical protein
MLHATLPSPRWVYLEGNLLPSKILEQFSGNGVTLTLLEKLLQRYNHVRSHLIRRLPGVRRVFLATPLDPDVKLCGRLVATHLRNFSTS